MEQSSHIFKIFKSSWGIWIQITAKHEFVDLISSDCLMVTENLGLRISKKHQNINDDYKELMVKGFRWVSENIEQSRFDKLIEIGLVDFQANPTDFQPEGFYYGIATRASNHFGFKQPNIKFSFNKEKNKYKFPELKI